MADVDELTAQYAAHRACCGIEHDPANGKIHGYCVVCGVPWPCEYCAKLPADASPLEPQEILGECDYRLEGPHKKTPECKNWKAAPTAAGSEEPKSQGLCDTTMTERFENKDCVCNTYPGNLGPCSKFEGGSNARCVFCDYELSCHLAVGKRKFEAVMADPVASQAPALKRPELFAVEYLVKGETSWRRTQHIPLEDLQRQEAILWSNPTVCGTQLVAISESKRLLTPTELLEMEANHE